MKYLFCILLYWAYTLGIYSGTLKFNHLSVNIGLSQQDIETAIQDRYGFLWFGSYDGLNRYDGYRIEVFRYDPMQDNSISDNRITALYEASDGKIYIGTEGSGLLYFDPKTDRFGNIVHNFFERGKSGAIFSICEIKEYGLFVGGTRGLFVIPDIKAEKPDVFRIPIEGHLDFRILKLFPDTDGSLWIGSQMGVVKVQLYDNYTAETLYSGFSQFFIYGITRLDADHLLIYGTNGVDILTLSNMQVPESCLSEKFKDQIVVSIIHYKDLFYIATHKDIWEWDKKNGPALLLSGRNNEFVKNNLIQGLLTDKNDNLWILSRNKGVGQLYLSPEKIGKYTLPEKDLFVKSMIIMKNGKKAIGVKDYGMLIEKGKGTHSFDHYFPGRTVAFIFEDYENNLWVYNGQMICIEPDGKQKVISSHPEFPQFKGHLTSVCQSPDSLLWFGSSRAIVRLNMESGQTTTEYIHYPKNKFASSVNLTLNIYYDKYHHSIWACTKEEGLYQYDLRTKVLKQYTITEGLTSNHVWCMAIGEDSSLWVGTDVGVNRLSFHKGEVKISPVSTDARIRNMKVMALCLDKENNLWINTSQGLFAYNIENKQIREYYYTDGLLSNTLSEVAFMDTSGLIWVSSISGVNFFKPGNLSPNPYKPDIVLRDLRIFNVPIRPDETFHGRVILTQSLLETKRIELKHDENNFQLEIAPIHYTNPAKNKIAYKLSGIDKEWIETRNRIISYNNLPSGTYLLEVKGSNSDETWNDKALRLEFVIWPAPWLSWWAFLIYILLSIGMVYVVYSYYTGKRKLSMELEREQIKRENDHRLNEAKISFHTNITHEIRTPLSLIIAPLHELMQIEINNTTAQRYIQTIARNTNQLANIVNQFLDFRKTVTMNYPLHVAEGNLSQSISTVASLFTEFALKKSINYQYLSDPEELTGWFDEEKVSKIVMNIVANALKYTPNNGSVFIWLEQQEDKAVVTIEDTGCGIATEDLPNIFSRYFQVDGNLHGGTGIGLSLAKQLALLHHGDIAVKSELNKGSSFLIVFPIMKEAYSEKERKKSKVSFTESSISPILLSQERSPSDIPAINQEGAPIVLIIEDNLELVDFIKSILSPKYRVYNTANGEEGLELAYAHTPDIIISDIMIEGMNGIELTKILKSDLRTSHIPIIILSARSSEEEVMEGLHIGAEDYLTKPFNPEVLKLKIANLIKLSGYNKNKKGEQKEKNRLSEREQKFINQLQEIILKEMKNPDFSIEYICKKIGTNRMQLHRKMMSLLGITASDYIKEIRFERAKSLLETTDMNISETMYEIGLSSLYNFTQTFQKIYHVTPTEIIRKRSGKG